MKKVLLIKATQLNEEGNPTHVKKSLQPPISLATIASLFPKNYNIKIVDEFVEKIDFNEEVDLVGVYSLTCAAKRAYEISKEFRKRNIPTIIGGPHASISPKECSKHFDSVFVGEVENTLSNFLKDFENNKLKKIYISKGKVDLSKTPLPRFDLINFKKYNGILGKVIMPIQSTGGCPFNCDFCIVEKMYGKRITKKPIKKVIDEIKATNCEYYFFVDDNILCDVDYAKELFESLIVLKKSYLVQLPTSVVHHPNLVELMGKAGVRMAFLGLESINNENLKQMNKIQNKISDYKKLFRLLLKNNIIPNPNFMIGLENDNEETYDETINFLNNAPPSIPLFSILTSVKGTESYKKYKKQGFILDENTDHYDGTHVVIKNNNLTSEEILMHFWRCYEKIYNVPSIMRRMFKFLLRKPKLKTFIVFVGCNIYARKMIKKRLHPYSGGI